MNDEKRHFSICGICNQSLVGGFQLFRLVYPACGDTNKQEKYLNKILGLTGNYHRRCVSKAMKERGFSKEVCKKFMNFEINNKDMFGFSGGDEK